MKLSLRFILLTLALVVLLFGATTTLTDQLFAGEKPVGDVTITPEYRNDGSISFTVKTVTNHGTYAPRHCFAIWITNAQGQFVKSLEVRASNYKQYLTRWRAASSYNTTGAITSASLNQHTTHTVTWNCRNLSNVEVPDGVYTVWVEFTERNGSGPYTSVQFTKGSESQTLTPANLTNFTNMNLTFTAIPVVGNDDAVAAYAPMLNQNYPNPFRGVTTIPYELKKTTNINLNIFNVKGQLVKKLENGTLPAGNYATSWNGTDQNGKRVSAGHYRCVLQVGSNQYKRDLTLVK